MTFFLRNATTRWCHSLSLVFMTQSRKGKYQKPESESESDSESELGPEGVGGAGHSAAVLMRSWSTFMALFKASRRKNQWPVQCRHGITPPPKIPFYNYLSALISLLGADCIGAVERLQIQFNGSYNARLRSLRILC